MLICSKGQGNLTHIKKVVIITLRRDMNHCENSGNAIERLGMLCNYLVYASCIIEKTATQCNTMEVRMSMQHTQANRKTSEEGGAAIVCWN